MPQTEQSEPPLPEIVGSAPAMREVYRMVRMAAPRSANVLLIGETGTGKEVIARAVHKLSKRSDGPYIRVNCGALHENLLESELFGHVKGAFERVGESRTIRVDVRVIAATNAALEDLVEAGQFREDLYYRLNVVPIA